MKYLILILFIIVPSSSSTNSFSSAEYKKLEKEIGNLITLKNSINARLADMPYKSKNCCRCLVVNYFVVDYNIKSQFSLCVDRFPYIKINYGELCERLCNVEKYIIFEYRRKEVEKEIKIKMIQLRKMLR